MYNGENYMVLPTAAPEDPGTITQGVRVSVLTPIVNIGRWKDYPKFDADIDLADSYYGFETEVVVECLCEEDWDDDMGRCAVAGQQRGQDYRPRRRVRNHLINLLTI